MRKTTAEKLQAEIEKKQQQENVIKRLQQQQKKEERKERDKRLYRRGAHIESLVSGSPDMTDEQFYRVIANALNRQSPYKKAEPVPAGDSADGSNSEVEAF